MGQKVSTFRVRPSRRKGSGRFAANVLYAVRFRRYNPSMKIVKSVFCALVGACAAGISSPALAALPDGYTELKYVQSTHDQYVKTGYIPNANTTIALKFSVMDYKARNEAKDTTLAEKNNVYIFGSYNDRCQFAYGAPGFCGFGTLYNNNVTLNGTKDSDIHFMGLTNNVFYVDGVSRFTGGGWSAGGKGKELYVFCLNANDGSKDIPKYWCALTAPFQLFS